MLADVAAVVDGDGIEIRRAGDVVFFTAEQRSELAVLAGPLAAWWQRHGPTTAGDVVLRFVGPNGVTEIGYCRPDLVVDQVRHTIEAESGRTYEPGEAPGVIRRLAARLLRTARTGFTATVLQMQDEDAVMSLALAGRELDDKPRSVEFQVCNPEHHDYDPDDDEGYCLVNEEHILVYGGLAALRLTRRALHLQLTREAARTWGLRSRDMTVQLRLDHAEVEQLRHGLKRIFSHGTAGQQTPHIDLG